METTTEIRSSWSVSEGSVESSVLVVFDDHGDGDEDDEEEEEEQQQQEQEEEGEEEEEGAEKNPVERQEVGFLILVPSQNSGPCQITVKFKERLCYVNAIYVSSTSKMCEVYSQADPDDDDLEYVGTVRAWIPSDERDSETLVSSGNETKMSTVSLEDMENSKPLVEGLARSSAFSSGDESWVEVKLSGSLDDGSQLLETQHRSGLSSSEEIEEQSGSKTGELAEKGSRIVKESFYEAEMDLSGEAWSSVTVRLLSLCDKSQVTIERIVFLVKQGPPVVPRNESFNSSSSMLGMLAPSLLQMVRGGLIPKLNNPNMLSHGQANMGVQSKAEIFGLPPSRDQSSTSREPACLLSHGQANAEVTSMAEMVVLPASRDQYSTSSEPTCLLSHGEADMGVTSKAEMVVLPASRDQHSTSREPTCLSAHGQANMGTTSKAEMVVLPASRDQFSTSGEPTCLSSHREANTEATSKAETVVLPTSRDQLSTSRESQLLLRSDGDSMVRENGVPRSALESEQTYLLPSESSVMVERQPELSFPQRESFSERLSSLESLCLRIESYLHSAMDNLDGRLRVLESQNASLLRGEGPMKAQHTCACSSQQQHCLDIPFQSSVKEEKHEIHLPSVYGLIDELSSDNSSLSTVTPENLGKDSTESLPSSNVKQPLCLDDVWASSLLAFSRSNTVTISETVPTNVNRDGLSVELESSLCLEEQEHLPPPSSHDGVDINAILLQHGVPESSIPVSEENLDNANEAHLAIESPTSNKCKGHSINHNFGGGQSLEQQKLPTDHLSDDRIESSDLSLVDDRLDVMAEELSPSKKHLGNSRISGIDLTEELYPSKEHLGSSRINGIDLIAELYPSKEHLGNNSIDSDSSLIDDGVDVMAEKEFSPCKENLGNSWISGIDLTEELYPSKEHLGSSRINGIDLIAELSPSKEHLGNSSIDSDLSLIDDGVDVMVEEELSPSKEHLGNSRISGVDLTEELCPSKEHLGSSRTNGIDLIAELYPSKERLGNSSIDGINLIEELYPSKEHLSNSSINRIDLMLEELYASKEHLGNSPINGIDLTEELYPCKEYLGNISIGGIDLIAEELYPAKDHLGNSSIDGIDLMAEELYPSKEKECLRNSLKESTLGHSSSLISFNADVEQDEDLMASSRKYGDAFPLDMLSEYIQTTSQLDLLSSPFPSSRYTSNADSVHLFGLEQGETNFPGFEGFQKLP